MTVDNILALGRTLTKTNTAQVSAANGLVFLNSVYHDAVAAFLQYVAEDFLFDIWTTDAIAGQEKGEYVFPAPDANNAGLAELKGVEVKPLSTSDYYVKAKPVDIRTLPYTWDWYLANQPASSPIYFVADDSLFLAPNFTSTTAGGADNAQIKLYGTKRVSDLVAGGAESTILIPREYHAKVLAKGLKHMIYDLLQKTSLKNDALTEYENEKLKMTLELSDRDISLGEANLPNDSHLE